jgi:hypothetical protein
VKIFLADRHTEHYFTFDDGSLAAHPYGWLLTRLLEGDHKALSGRAGWASYCTLSSLGQEVLVLAPAPAMQVNPTQLN